MKVLDLQCEQQHLFEGWFGSEDDFQSQLARQLVSCPLCASTVVSKRLSAPRLNLGASDNRAEPARAETQKTQDKPQQMVAMNPEQAQTLQQLQTAYMAMVRQVVQNTEDVGDRFASEARKIYEGQAPERGIRGQATPDEAQALVEEGIAVVPLPLPEALKGPLH
jgi:hypothetical protein